MRARHHARSTGTTITETEQRSRGRSHGNSFMRGSGSAAISGSGVSAGTVDGANSSNSLSMGYDPLSQNFMTPNLPLSMNIGSGDSASHSHIASESSQRSKSLSSYEGTNQSDSTSESEGHGTSYSASIAHMDGESIGAGVAHGTSQSQGVSEAWETIYKPLPGSFHSKEHELYFKGEQIRNLPVGRAIARIGKTTTFLNVPPPRKSNTKPGDASPTALAALIAKTSAAQPREQIIQRREACEQERRQRLSKPTPSDDAASRRLNRSRLSTTRINTQPIFGNGLTRKKKRSANHPNAQSRASWSTTTNPTLRIRNNRQHSRSDLIVRIAVSCFYLIRELLGYTMPIYRLAAIEL